MVFPCLASLRAISYQKFGLPATACVFALAKPVSSPLASVTQANRSTRSPAGLSVAT